MITRFSQRIGVPKEVVPITIRYGVDDELREYMFIMISQYIKSYHKIREIACVVTRKSPDRNNWGENDFMKEEILTIFRECQWYYVYDIIEKVFENIVLSTDKQLYERDVNDYFCQKGIGWKMVSGILEYRGDDVFEEKISNTTHTLKEAHLNTSANEIKEAIEDLSKKPNPEITGAIQHSVAALECVVRKVVGSKETLGKLMNDHPEIVPKPTNEIITKIFGYASEWGRHLTEGRNPDYEEAELIVSLSASFCSYLVKKSFPKDIL